MKKTISFKGTPVTIEDKLNVGDVFPNFRAVTKTLSEFELSDYKGKKLSDSEGVGTTGKIFKSQKEALDFGRKEVRRLVDEDKKPRQFSISKVTAEDGSLVGWTVDIFEDNSVEKIVSSPTEDTEKNKDKE